MVYCTSKFNSGEHVHIGELVYESLTLPDLHKSITLPNGVVIKFEQIIALAGDFYGLPEHPIIDPFNRLEEDSGRYQRFQDAYDTLARTPREDLQKELGELLAILQKEIQEGKDVDPKTLDEITGGKWYFGVPVKQGRMLQLAKNNHDHFLPYAKDAYLTGHQLALKKVRLAGTKPNPNLMDEALSMEAFACHFLTDSFASGHIRTPRVELGKATTLGIDGHLLCKYMHDEDNKYGLRVTNKRGDKWIAYGDGMLLKEESKDNLKYAVEAVRRSVKQLYGAVGNPSVSLDPSEVTDLIPFVDQEERNNSPMFQVKDGKVHRRLDLNDLQDIATTASWWGPTTVATMSTSLTYNPGNSAI